MKFLLSLFAAAVDASEVDRRRVALGEQVVILGAFAPELNKLKSRSIEVTGARS